MPYHFRKLGGLNFLLRCNYNPKHLPQLPIFYSNILKFFKELKTLYGYDPGSDLVLFNNRKILVDNKTVYFNNWVENDIILIKDLLKDDGSYLSFQEFSDKFACKTNFLQYYQIISAIPNQLLLKNKYEKKRVAQMTPFIDIAKDSLPNPPKQPSPQTA